MNVIHATICVSVTELKKNPTAVFEQAEGQPVVILNHNRPAAYLLPAATYDALLEELEDAELARIVKERESEPLIKVLLHDL